MKFLVILALIGMAGCGYEQRGNEVSGQVKRVIQVTPLICPARTLVDLSLGIVRGGVG